MNRKALSRLLFAASMMCALNFLPAATRSEPTAVAGNSRLDLVIVGADSHEKIPARVLLRDTLGHDHIPDGAVEVPIGPDRWFVADGSVKLLVPAGRMLLRVERGPEYDPLLQTISVGPTGVTRHRVSLKRWIDLRELGYASGENHLHVPPEQLGAMLAAEDLDFGTSLSWWNGPAFDVGAGGRFRTLSFGKHRIPATVFDAEVEHQWGAVYLVGLKTPMTLVSDSKRPNLPFVQFARDQGALICYQAGWSREVFLDALLGYVDVVNVCNNNFHRHKFQPRRQYSNLLNLAGFPEYPDTPEGMMRMNTDTYYRLLNCGLRLAAGAGSATGAKTTPVGYNRCYARVGRRGTISDFLESWRQGRNFVTDGPMIFLTVNDSHTPGDVIALPAEGGKMRANVRVLSDQPLRSLEIVVNGTVASHADLPAAAFEAKLNVNLDLHKGCWIAARATAEDRLLSDEDMMRYDNAGEGSRRQKPCRQLFGHTSPVYVTVGGAGASVETSVQEAFQMLEGFERFAMTLAAEPCRDEIRAALRLARWKLKALSNGG